MRTLRIAAAVEAASLIVLLVNLLTVHAKPVTSLCGPLHGMAYLVAIAMTWTAPGSATSRARPLSLVPGAGAMLALRRLNGHAAEGPAAAPQATQATGRRAGS
ncbi:DUF3817 domain-containing protein [Streptomyces flaveolus]|uniref:DUF3817 domain-containing protein n=1 Tax=Streptomyces flaveolus TaxID=67297 RepID=UPI003328B11A